MEKYIHLTVASDSDVFTVGQFLRSQGHLTKRSAVPNFILMAFRKTVSAAASRNLYLPVTRSVSAWKLPKWILSSLFQRIFLLLTFCMKTRMSLP